MAIEIVDFPNEHMVIFHTYVNVYQRVDWTYTRKYIGNYRIYIYIQQL